MKSPSSLYVSVVFKMTHGQDGRMVQRFGGAYVVMRGDAVVLSDPAGLLADVQGPLTPQRQRCLWSLERSAYLRVLALPLSLLPAKGTLAS